MAETEAEEKEEEEKTRSGDGISRVFGFGCVIGFDAGSCFGWNAKAMTCPGFLVLAVGLVLTVALEMSALCVTA